MKFFENWILRKADSIKNRPIEKELPVKMTPEQIKIAIREHSKVLLEEIKSGLQKPRFKVGQVLYLDVFFVNETNGSYNWDGGPYTLIRCLEKPELLKIPKVEVTKVVIDTTWFDEIIDSFIERDANEIDAKNYDIFKAEFRKFIYDKRLENKELERNWLVYYDVKFKPLSFTFSPIWGLSEYSWLKQNSALGKKSKEIWEKKQKLGVRLEETRKELNSIEDQIKGLDNSFNV